MSILHTISSVIIQGAIALGPFTVLLLLNRKPRQPYLISIILCFSLIVSHSYYIRAGLRDIIESPFIIAEPFIFLISPLLYFYFENLTTRALKPGWKDLIHTLPFFFFFASFIPISQHGPQTLYYNFLYSNKIVMTGFLWIVLVAQFLYYYSRIYKLNRDYTARLAQQHSNYIKYEASWVRVFLLLFLATLAFVSVVLFVFLHNSTFKHFSTIVALFYSLQVYFISYKGLSQKTFIIDPEMDYNPRKAGMEQDSPLTDHRQLAKKEKLEEYMQKEKPYLNPELTLIDLATQLEMSRNELSALINNVLGSNFYLYVNAFRIDHVKRLISEDAHKQFTILALAYESGFNSKSTFNTIFKKFSGLTPSEYRKSLGKPS